ncbi:hypothetical protein HOF65_05600 [bacterium]|nr:hypothetical protein [bacterium]MBT3853416.1 hypothetical protein [bacterium]MBT4633381.1 hypothetical protein [bacterium]
MINLEDILFHLSSFFCLINISLRFFLCQNILNQYLNFHSDSKAISVILDIQLLFVVELNISTIFIVHHNLFALFNASLFFIFSNIKKSLDK